MHLKSDATDGDYEISYKQLKSLKNNKNKQHNNGSNNNTKFNINMKSPLKSSKTMEFKASISTPHTQNNNTSNYSNISNFVANNIPRRLSKLDESQTYILNYKFKDVLNTIQLQIDIFELLDIQEKGELTINDIGH